MKTKISLTFVTTILIWTLYSFTSRQINERAIVNQTDTTKNYLQIYGEYVFNREGCENCHSLQITDKTKISLDGLKGKYPGSWHLNHLIDPTSMVPDSKMPSYIYLMDIKFKRDTIEKYIKTLSNKEWQNVINQSNIIKKEMKSFGIDVESNTDIVALINYIENIPQTEECKLIRDKEIKKAIREKDIKDSIWAASENSIQIAINDPNNISNGQNIYKLNCSVCHGINGEGMIGPNLTDDFWLNGGKENNILNSIKNGIPDKGMMSWKNTLTPIEVGQLVSYIKSIKGSNPKNPKSSQGKKE